MVTKSETEETLHEAIGRRADDYIIKPTSPRQVLSVVTRLLAGARIRHQQAAREFTERFGELRDAIIKADSWGAWAALGGLLLGAALLFVRARAWRTMGVRHALALVGLLIGYRRQPYRVPLLVALLALILVTALFFVTARYRIQALPLVAVLAGGAVPPGTTISHEHMLDLEREGFMKCMGERKTLERMQHILKTGKPLRN